MAESTQESSKQHRQERERQIRDDEPGPGASRVALFTGLVVLVVTLAAGWAAGKGGLITTGVADPLSALHFEAPGNGPVHFSGRMDRGAVLARGDGVVRMELLLAADRPEGIAPPRVPTDLVVVLDRSGSMRGKPLGDAVAAVRELIASLAEEDRFALVTYASDVQLAIPMQHASAQNRAAWVRTANAVYPGGGTNMAIGIDAATEMVAASHVGGRAPRVIVLSDGHANQGDHSLLGLRARAAKAVPGEYVLSAVGVGLDFDESLMAALADSGTGNFYYVPDAAQLGEVFAGEFDSARETLARALTVEVELAPGVELMDAAGYPVERDGRVARFRPGALFAGQERRVWLTLRAPTAAAGDHALGRFALDYVDAREGGQADGEKRRLAFARTPQVACVEREEHFAAALDRDLVTRGIAGDALAELKQQVAQSVSVGKFSEAQERIGRYRKDNAVLYEQMEMDAESTDSDVAAAKLEDEVSRAASAPAPERKAFSKQLSAEGYDGRRAGAKK